MNVFTKEYTYKDLTIKFLRQSDQVFQVDIHPTSPDVKRSASGCRTPQEFRAWGEWNAKACQLLQQLGIEANSFLDIANQPQHSATTYFMFMNGSIKTPEITNDDLEKKFKEALKAAERFIETRPPSTARKR